YDVLAQGTVKVYCSASVLLDTCLFHARPAISRSCSPASRRPRPICVSRSDSRGLRGGPWFRSTYGGTSGWRIIGLPASRRAHVTTSALLRRCRDVGLIHQRLARYSSTHAADALA